jgi:hypothetical protein
MSSGSGCKGPCYKTLIMLSASTLVIMCMGTMLLDAFYGVLQTSPTAKTLGCITSEVPCEIN